MEKNYDDEEAQRGQAALDRALQLIGDRDQLAASIAEREEWLQTHYVPDRSPPEPELQTRQMTTELAALQGRVHQLEAALRREMAARRNEVEAALQNERKVQRKALRAALEALADGAGKEIASLRAQLRAINARLAPDATVLDLPTERRLRAVE